LNVGIGLPTSIPGVDRETILEWAKRVDAGPFSSLVATDRVVYPNYEPLITLAAVAGATTRVRLMTAVLLAPIRNAGILAKQVASLDSISGGRLTLGLGVGRREDDFRAAPASYTDRGKRFEDQLALMKRIWAGEPVGDGVGPIGPPPKQKGGPEILLGAVTPIAIRRISRWADGLLATPATTERIREHYSLTEKYWKEAGRSGKPRLVSMRFYALGPNAAERGLAKIRHYYSFAGEKAESIAQPILSTPQAVKEAIKEYSAIGLDELILSPTLAEIDQVDRLAEVTA
jgi:alkanesulfonate monooxygenase SsuD/methylene tetrahydromethanopterin reductase-like flavin-dependent oxidoreductase (luciferase family)